MAAVGCGGSSDEDDRSAARYLHPDAQLVATIDLDYDGGQWQQIKRLYARAAGKGIAREAFGSPLPATLDGALETLARSFVGLSFDRDVRPLLDGKVFLGVHVTPAAPLSERARDLLERVDPDETRFDPRRGRQIFVDRDGRRLDTRQVESAMRERAERRPSSELDVAVRVRDREALDRLLERLEKQGLERRPLRAGDDAELLGDSVALVGGHTLVAVFAESPGEDGTEALLRARLRGKGPPAGRMPPAEGEALARVRAAPGLLGLLLDRGELRRGLETPPGRALRSADLALSLHDAEARLDGRLDFSGLPTDQLPLPPRGPVQLPRDAGIGSATSDQSRTTVFLARLVRRLYPRSRFVRRVKALERRERLRFEDAVLRQFTGPSQSILRPTAAGDTRFAARSSLSDPTEMRRLLPRIAPRLPGILEGLEGLGQAGLAGLLLVAPDAPLTPDAFALLSAVDVRRLPRGGASTGGGERDLLYEITGLEQRGVAGLDRVVYGVIGDDFVVASDRALARSAATMPTEQAAPAGTRLHVDITRVLRDAGGETDDALRLVDALVGAIDVEASAVGGDVVLRGRVRWADR